MTVQHQLTACAMLAAGLVLVAQGAIVGGAVVQVIAVGYMLWSCGRD